MTNEQQFARVDLDGGTLEKKLAPVGTRAEEGAH
jgi:hypothetical protein